MAVEKRLEESEIALMDPDGPAQEVQVAIVNPEAVSIETEDGGMIIDFDPQKESPDSEFGSNLVEFIDDTELERIGSELISAYSTIC